MVLGTHRLCGRRPGTRAPQPAFTLMETALTTVIIGVGVLALIESQQAFMRSNDWSTNSATATYLAGELRELTRKLPRHDPVTGLYLESQGGTTTLRGWGRETGETEASDIDDIDDLDGLTFTFDGVLGEGNDLPGPIDAFGEIIPQTLADGSGLTDDAGSLLPLQGWSQSVTVQKIDPFDSSLVRNDNAVIAGQNGADGVEVDEFPLRVTVIVRYQGPDDVQAREMATVVWIVP